MYANMKPCQTFLTGLSVTVFNYLTYKILAHPTVKQRAGKLLTSVKIASIIWRIQINCLPLQRK